MDLQHIPHFMISIVIAALAVQITCALINVIWKISTHTAAIGGFMGALFVFADAFGFNPVWWFCLLFMMAGLLGSSRMILRQHTLSQVVAGFFIGFIVAVLAIIYI
jgi:membrane-associated phospholipid phosphatase